MNTISAVVIGSTIIICAAWIITSIVTTLKQRANTRTRAEVFNKLIDKFGTAPEFIEFLRSDAGLRFIEEQTVEYSPMLTKILGSVRFGVSLTLIGGGTLIFANAWDIILGNDIFTIIALAGTVALTAGVGFIIAAAVSYRLCRSWGLIPSIEKAKPDAD